LGRGLLSGERGGGLRPFHQGEVDGGEGSGGGRSAATPLCP